MPTEVNDLASYQQFAMQQAQANNEWSAKQADINRDWQKMMSDTAHQREVADLKAAGLNPILSANSGAAVGSGAVGDTDTSAAGNIGSILQQVLSAQSAREVAGMYNAATIAAATISANASMHNAEVAAETQREYPNSVGGILGRAIREGQSFLAGDKGILDPSGPFQQRALTAFSNLGIPMYPRNIIGFRKFLFHNNKGWIPMSDKNFWSLYSAWKTGGFQKFAVYYNKLYGNYHTHTGKF